MAVEQDLQLEPDNTDEAGGSKKKRIVIVVVAALLITIIAAVTIFLIFGQSEEEEVAANEFAEMVEDVVVPAQYVKMKPPFIVNYNLGTRQRFLQTSIEIMTRSQGVVDAIELHNPMLRNSIVRILSEQEFKYLRTPEGRSELRAILQTQLVAVLKAEADIEGIEAVLFTDFVMQ